MWKQLNLTSSVRPEFRRPRIQQHRRSIELSMGQTQSFALSNISPISQLTHLTEMFTPLDHDQKCQRRSHGDEGGTNECVLDAKFKDPRRNSALLLVAGMFEDKSITYAYEVIANPKVFRITMTVIIASPLNSGYVSIQ